MDIELARTFLMVSETRNFVRAAERLFVTQSTVSARIKALEEQVGRPLFVRNKAGVSLTAAGERFTRHATTLVHVWQHAKSDIELPRGFSDIVRIGARFGLWDPILLEWLSVMAERYQEIALRAEIGMSDQILSRISEGALDLGVVYAPEQLPGFKAEPLFLERMVLVSTSAENINILPDNYIHIDWGAQFIRKFDLSFPNRSGNGVTINFGVLGLDFILKNGGSGYFPERMLSAYLSDETLHLVSKAPIITLPVFLLRLEDNTSPAIQTSIDLLMSVIEKTIDKNLSL